MKVCTLLSKRPSVLNTKLVVGVFIVDAKSDLNLYKGSSYLPQSSCGGCGNKETTSDIAELDFNEWVGQLLSSVLD